MIWWTTLALAAPSETPIRPAPSPEVVRALSSRHPVPCADVAGGQADPAGELLAVVDQVAMPPWAPMRAADCLVLEHAQEERTSAAMRAWVVDPERLGLGRLVVQRLDRLEEDLAVELGTRAWTAGHDRAYLRRHFARSAWPALQALVRDVDAR